MLLRGELREGQMGRMRSKGGKVGWSQMVHDTRLQMLSNWQGGSLLSPGPCAGEGHGLIRVGEADCCEVLFSLGIIDL